MNLGNVKGGVEIGIYMYLSSTSIAWIIINLKIELETLVKSWSNQEISISNTNSVIFQFNI